MRNKLPILLAILGLLCSSAQSQTLTPTVISSSGGFYSNSEGMLSFTVAEMTMVQTFTTPGNILTQGFQQPEDYTSGIDELADAPDNVLVYPNPTSGSFTLSFYNNDNIETTTTIFNLAGQVVLEKKIPTSAGLNTVNFNIGTLSQGMYILELTITDNKGEKKSDYHKINLIY